MPRITLAEAENRIRQLVPNVNRTKLRRAAKLAKRSIDTAPRKLTEEEMFRLFKTLTYPDPTGETASRNADNAARRLAERKAS